MGREFLGVVRAVLAATLLSLKALLAAACANPSATLAEWRPLPA
jgi:hypothetical protein